MRPLTAARPGASIHILFLTVIPPGAEWKKRLSSNKNGALEESIVFLKLNKDKGSRHWESDPTRIICVETALP